MPPFAFKSLKATELETLRRLLAPLGDWCSVALEGFNGLALARVQKDTSTVLLAIADSYRFSTSQHLTRKAGRRDKKVTALRSSLPSPDCPAYKATLGLLTEALECQVASARAKRQKRLHGALANGRRIQRAVDEALRPT